jgi:hypothetical protein
MTPFAAMVVPPPMSTYHLRLPSPVMQVAFSPQSDCFLVLLSDESLVYYDFSKGGINVLDVIPS